MDGLVSLGVDMDTVKRSFLNGSNWQGGVFTEQEYAVRLAVRFVCSSSLLQAMLELPTVFSSEHVNQAALLLASTQNSPLLFFCSALKNLFSDPRLTVETVGAMVNTPRVQPSLLAHLFRALPDAKAARALQECVAENNVVMLFSSVVTMLEKPDTEKACARVLLRKPQALARLKALLFRDGQSEVDLHVNCLGIRLLLTSGCVTADAVFQFYSKDMVVAILLGLDMPAFLWDITKRRNAVVVHALIDGFLQVDRQDLAETYADRDVVWKQYLDSKLKERMSALQTEWIKAMLRGIQVLEDKRRRDVSPPDGKRSRGFGAKGGGAGAGVGVGVGGVVDADDRDLDWAFASTSASSSHRAGTDESDNESSISLSSSMMEDEDLTSLLADLSFGRKRAHSDL